ncbi:MAG: hypothetical protein NVSMB20_03230 [Bradyrhizobium sp.]
MTALWDGTQFNAVAGTPLGAADLNAAIQTRYPSTNPSNFIAAAVKNTGGTVVRNIVDKLGEMLSVKDFGAKGDGVNDDAIAFRAAVGSNRRIYVPPGTYTFKSTIIPYGTATDPACIEMRGLTDCWLIAYGATFLIDNSISSPVPVNTLTFTSNSKHCGILGGTFVGNATGLASSQENVAINFDSVTNITVRDVKITGTHLAAFTGVYGFDCLIDNVHCFNNALGLDIAHMENLTVRGCRFQANPSNPVTGVNHHYDTPTLADNNTTDETGLPRQLRGGVSNRIRVFDCVFDGFQNSIALEDTVGSVISRNTIRGVTTTLASGTSGVLLYLGTNAKNAGLVNSDTTIEDNDITGCGNTSGGTGAGVLIGANVVRVALRNNRIYENAGYGVAANSTVGVSGLTAMGNDFASRSGSVAQIAPYQPAIAGLIGANFGDIATGYNVSIRADATYMTTPINSSATGSVAYFTNNSNLSFADSAGTQRPTYGVTATNVTYVQAGSAAAYVALKDVAGVDCLQAGQTGVRIARGVSAWSATPPASQPTITGSRGGNVALASLLTALAATGLIVDGTSV